MSVITCKTQFFIFIGSFSLLALATSCAKEIKGAGSASLSLAAYEVSAPPTTEFLFQKKGLRFGLGASNLRPFLVLGYVGEKFGVGMGLGGLTHSGLKSSYSVGVGDISFIHRTLSAERSLLGLGGGLGGALAKDYNFSEQGKTHHLRELHGYGLFHLAYSPMNSKMTLFFAFKIGAYLISSTYLRDQAEKLKNEDPYIRVKETFSGFLFGPTFGMQFSIIENKALLSFNLSIPLSSALFVEPDLHPYVPSLNFVLVY